MRGNGRRRRENRAENLNGRAGAEAPSILISYKSNEGGGQRRRNGQQVRGAPGAVAARVGANGKWQTNTSSSIALHLD